MAASTVDNEVIDLLKIDSKGWNVALFADKIKITTCLCNKCNHICYDAVELECDHDDTDIYLYCENCLNNLIKDNNNNCPINGHSHPIPTPNRAIRRQVLRSKVHCPYSITKHNNNDNAQIIDTIGGDEKEGITSQKSTKVKENGCHWSGTLNDLIKTHMSQCVQKYNPSFVQNIAIKKLTCENEQLRYVINSKDKKIKELQQQIETLGAEITKQQLQNNDKQKVNDLQTQMQQLKNENKKLQNEKTILQSVIDDKEKLIKQLQQQIITLTARANQQSQQNQKLNNELHEQRISIQDRDTKMSLADETIQKVKNENVKLTTELTEVKKMENKKWKIKENEIKKLKNELQDKDVQISSMERKMQNLEKLPIEVKNESKCNDDKQKSKKDMSMSSEKMILNLQQKILTLTAQANQQSQQNQKLNTELHEQMQQLKNENKKLQNEKTMLQSVVGHQSQQNQKLKNDNLKITTRRNSLQFEVTKMQNTGQLETELKDNIIRLEIELNKKRISIQDKDTQISMTEKTIQKLKNEIKKLKNELQMQKLENKNAPSIKKLPMEVKNESKDNDEKQKDLVITPKSVADACKNIYSDNPTFNWFSAKLMDPKVKTVDLKIDRIGNGGLPEIKHYLSQQKEHIIFCLLVVHTYDSKGAVRDKFFYGQYFGPDVNKLAKIKLIQRLNAISGKFPKKHLSMICNGDLSDWTAETLSREFKRIGDSHKACKYDYGGGLIYNIEDIN